MTTAVVHSEAQRIELLSALVAADGRPKAAAVRLRDQGTEVTWMELKRLRQDHPATYQALAVEHARTTEEAMVVEYRELARLGQRATRNYLEDLVDAQEDGTLDQNQQRALPQIIQALAKVQQVSTDKLLSMTGRPTDGGNTDPLRAAKDLIEMGVLKPVERPTVESTAVEVDG